MGYIQGLLKDKKIIPARVFSMADSTRSNKIKLENIMITLPKLIPDIPKMVIDEIPVAL
jgi:hypothetical protein